MNPLVPTGPVVAAVFPTQDAAADALEQLRAAGVTPEQVSLVVADQPDAAGAVPDPSDEAASGAATGGIVGGVVGGLAGWLLGVGALAIPGIGPVLSAGILGSLLAGAAVGAAAGGLLGGLAGMGIPEEHARDYEAHVREGRVLLTVHPPDAATAARLRAILDSSGGTDTRAYGDRVDQPAAAEPDPAPLIENTLPVDPIRDEMVAPAAEPIANIVDDGDDGADGEVGVAPEPPHATWGGEALGAAAGAIAGGVLGAVVGGPLGAAVGVAVGGGAGSGAVHLASEPNPGPRGTEIGAGTGALVGGIMGSPGGPLGAAVGAALGAALGGASGELVQDATEEIIAEREAVAAHSREEAALAEVPSGASADPAAGSLPVPDTGASRALGAAVSPNSAASAATPAMIDTAVPQAAPATGHDGGPATATP
ncbi:MAG TPA: YMGG-like glycine zipper-containing protein, partial [Chloroflexia bacterium]|nr:YMGG-like glycine zipper-containing protein [Chloroflexia bacterium]